MFTDGAGCSAVCAAAGLVCSAAYEDIEGQCAPDLTRPEVSCDSGHNSDFCVCTSGACTPDCDGKTCGPDGCGGLCQGVSCQGNAWEDILAKRVGYGRNASGGAGGPECWVTSLSNSGAGTLRSCAESSGKKWIRFNVSGTIQLNSRISVASDKTIDGRGQDVVITGEGLDLDGVNNVIIHNIRFQGGDDDAIKIVNGTTNVWVDHVTLANYFDGLLDITRESTNITVSWCRFENHDKVMLISHSPDHTKDEVIRVTLHHNYFNATTQRNPRVRFGRVHAFNNYFRAWKSYGIGASMLSQVLSEHNVFEAGSDKDAIITQVGDDPQKGNVRSVGDLELNGAQIQENSPGSVWDPNSDYSYSLEAADVALRSAIQVGAGWQSVPAP